MQTWPRRLPQSNVYTVERMVNSRRTHLHIDSNCCDVGRRAGHETWRGCTYSSVPYLPSCPKPCLGVAPQRESPCVDAQPRAWTAPIFASHTRPWSEKINLRPSLTGGFERPFPGSRNSSGRLSGWLRNRRGWRFYLLFLFFFFFFFLLFFFILFLLFFFLFYYIYVFFLFVFDCFFFCFGTRATRTK